jgi:hypothetical protein
MAHQEAPKAFLFRPIEYKGLSREETAARILQIEEKIAGAHLSREGFIAPPAAIIIGQDMRAIYERFFDTQTPSGPDGEESYLRSLLVTNHVIPVVVPEHVMRHWVQIKNNKHALEKEAQIYYPTQVVFVEAPATSR